MIESLLKQFNKLQGTQPSADWHEKTRNFLFARVIQDTVAQEANTYSRFKIFSLTWSKNLTPSLARVLSVLVLVALLGGTGIFVQAEYVPSRPLYTVKRTFEKLELALAVTPQSETKIHLKHAEKRANEAVRLAKKTDFSDMEKENNINTVVKSLATDLNAAKNSLDTVNDTNAESATAMEMAMEISQNVQNNMAGLDEVKSVASLENVTNAVTEVQSTIEEVENASIKVLIEGSENAQLDQSIISKEAVKEIVSDKIKRTDNKIKQIDDKINQLNTAAKETIAENSSVVSMAAEKSTEAQQILSDAKTLLEQGSLTESLDKIAESNNLAVKTQTDLAKAVEQENPAADLELTTTPSQASTTPADLNNELGSEPTTTLETTPNIINFAPLGGPVNQSAGFSEMIIRDCSNTCINEQNSQTTPNQ